MKLSLIYEHHHKQIHQVWLTDGKTAETTSGQALWDQLLPKELVTRDLGYLTVEALKAIASRGAFFLSRLTKGIPLFLTGDATATPIDLPSYLEQRFKGQSVMDLRVYLGPQKFPVRLIAYRAPDEVINQRRRKAYEAARKKNRKPSEDYLSWLGFTFYLTHVPKERWAPKFVGTIYRLRWQLELIFKQWKSLLGIQCLKGTRKNRIRCLSYGRLIAIVLMSMVYRCLCCYAYAVAGREPSPFKLTAWLLRGERLAKAVRNHQLDELFDALLIAAPKGLFKQQRHRKTTLQLIEQQVEFLHSF